MPLEPPARHISGIGSYLQAMTPANVKALRLSLGATISVAVSYGAAWPLYFVVPLFTVIFLSLPIPWMGWKMAFQIMRRLAVALLCGLLVSEFLLPFPLGALSLPGVGSEVLQIRPRFGLIREWNPRRALHASTVLDEGDLPVGGLRALQEVGVHECPYQDVGISVSNIWTAIGS